MKKGVFADSTGCAEASFKKHSKYVVSKGSFHEKRISILLVLNPQRSPQVWAEAYRSNARNEQSERGSVISSVPTDRHVHSGIAL